jgi:hypothetical protein
VLAAAVAGTGGLALVRLGEALPGTVVGTAGGAEGVDVGGLGEDDLRARVVELAQARTSGTVTVRAADVAAGVPRDLVTVDVDATVERALEVGSPLGLLLPEPRTVPLVLSVDQERLDEQVDALAERVDRAPASGGFAVQGLTVQARPPVAGRALAQEAAAEGVAQALEQGRSEPLALAVDPIEPTTTQAQVDAVVAAARAALAGPYTLGQGEATVRLAPEQLAPLLRSELVDGVPALRLDTAGLRAVVAAQADEVATAPRSASFSVDGRAPLVEDKGDLTWSPRPADVTVLPGAAGRALDVGAATARLAELVLSADRRQPQPLPVTPVPPALTTEQARAAGVRELIGTFTTRFTPGQPRATNIRRIAGIVDGTYVAPGEVLSLNEAAGRRTPARGFVADGAIVDGELTDEVGGGVSQFATTLFNAAFFAGLPILEHKPHSFYIPRYPAGRESTVYYGAIDVKVRNNTDSGLLVRTRSTPGSVTVELYGDNGGRRVTSTAGPRRPRADGGFRIDVVRTTTGGDGRGGRRVFSTSYDPVPPE